MNVKPTVHPMPLHPATNAAAATRAALPKPSETAAPNSPARLRWACNELQAQFLDQLFQSMRDTVPADGLDARDGSAGDNSGEEMFNSLLDDHVASVSAQREQGGLGEALYNQLVRRLTTEDPK